MKETNQTLKEFAESLKQGSNQTLTEIADKLKQLTMQVETYAREQEEMTRFCNKFMNFDQACEYLGVTRSALHTMTCRKKIPYYKPSGRAIYFLENDLLAWIEAKRVKSAAEIESEAAALIV